MAYAPGKRKNSSTSSTTSLPDGEQEDLRMPKPPIRLEEHSQTLGHILQHHDLPRVVQCDPGTQAAFVSTGSTIDFRKPLLLYKRRSVRKVTAHSLVFDRACKEFVGVGNDLLIPEDYKGYFAVLGHPDSCHADQVIPYFGMASKLAIAPCTEFLVGGDKPVSALRVEGGMRSSIKPSPCQLFPGDVLRKGGIFEATSKVKTKGKGVFSRKKYEERTEHFLHCFDSEDREVLLPDSTTGTFITLAQDGAAVKFPVVTLKGLLGRFRLPLITKLVTGRVPSTPCSFSGTLLLSDSGMDRTVIASTLLNHRNINIEIPINAGLRFYVAEHSPGLLGSRAFDSASKMCLLQSDMYMRNMKVFHKIQGSIQSPPALPGCRPTSKKDSDSFASDDEIGSQSSGESGMSSRSSRSSRTSSSGTSSTSTYARDNVFASQGRVALPSLQVSRMPRRSASLISRTSVWSEITSSVTVNDDDHDIFVPMSQKTRHSGWKASGKSRSSDASSVETERVTESTKILKELLLYQKPKPLDHEVIPIVSNTPGKGEDKKQSLNPTAGTAPPEYDHYDQYDQYDQYDSIVQDHAPVPPARSESMSIDQDPNLYMSIWETEEANANRTPSPSSQSSPFSRDDRVGSPALASPPRPCQPTVDPGYLLRPQFLEDTQQKEENKDVSPTPPPTSKKPLRNPMLRVSSEENWQPKLRSNNLHRMASFNSSEDLVSEDDSVIYENLACFRRIETPCSSKEGSPHKPDLDLAKDAQESTPTSPNLGSNMPEIPPLPKNSSSNLSRCYLNDEHKEAPSTSQIPPIPPIPPIPRRKSSEDHSQEVPTSPQPRNLHEYNRVSSDSLTRHAYEPLSMEMYDVPKKETPPRVTSQESYELPNVYNELDPLYCNEPQSVAGTKPHSLTGHNSATESHILTEHNSVKETNSLIEHASATEPHAVTETKSVIKPPSVAAPEEYYLTPPTIGNSRPPSSTDPGTYTSMEECIEKAKRDVSASSFKNIHGSGVFNEFRMKIDQRNEKTASANPRLNTPGPRQPQKPDVPSFSTPVHPESVSLPFSKPETKKSSSGVRSDRTEESEDLLSDIADAGLSSKTINSIRELTREKIESFLQSEVEIEELRVLLPNVPGIELRKVLMYMKSKISKK